MFLLQGWVELNSEAGGGSSALFPGVMAGLGALTLRYLTLGRL